MAGQHGFLHTPPTVSCPSRIIQWSEWKCHPRQTCLEANLTELCSQLRITPSNWLCLVSVDTKLLSTLEKAVLWELNYKHPLCHISLKSRAKGHVFVACLCVCEVCLGQPHKCFLGSWPPWFWDKVSHYTGVVPPPPIRVGWLPVSRSPRDLPVYLPSSGTESACNHYHAWGFCLLLLFFKINYIISKNCNMLFAFNIKVKQISSFLLKTAASYTPGCLISMKSQSCVKYHCWRAWTWIQHTLWIWEFESGFFFSGIFFFFYFIRMGAFTLCVGFFCLLVSVHHMAQCPWRPKEGEDTQQLELQKIVSHQVGAGLWTLVLWKSHCSYHHLNLNFGEGSHVAKTGRTFTL